MLVFVRVCEYIKKSQNKDYLSCTYKSMYMCVCVCVGVTTQQAKQVVIAMGKHIRKRE